MSKPCTQAGVAAETLPGLADGGSDLCGWRLAHCQPLERRRHS